jgi:quinol monooxygenase YgiN
MIVIEAILQTSSDARGGLMALMCRTMAISQREKGCILYRFTADLESPNRFVLTEIWQTEDDLKAHFKGEASKSFFAELPGKGEFVSSTAWQGLLDSYVPPNQAVLEGSGARTP